MRKMRKRNGFLLCSGVLGAGVSLFLGGCTVKNTVKDSETEDSQKETPEEKLFSEDSLVREGITALVRAEYPQEPVFQNEDEQFDYHRNRRMKLPEQFVRSYEEFVADTSPDILTEAGKEKQNVIYSPLSLYYALALAAEGASGETKEEFLSLLHYEDPEALSADCKTSFESFYHVPREENNHPNEWGEYPQESRYTLQIANSLWADEGMDVNETFLDRINEFSYADLYQADLQKDETAQAMADWVKEKTNGVLTPAALPLGEEGLISLRNTVYFYDEWMDRFDKEQTAEDWFTCEDGIKVSSEFMNRTMGSHGFQRGENYTKSSLSLKNGQMTFYLPDEGVSVEDLIKTPEAFRKLFQGEEEWCSGEVIWKVPKFSYGGQLNLSEVLEHAGLSSAFSEEADFSALTDQTSLFLSAVNQDAHIGIDENGVEAAAFTEISWAGAAMPTDRAEMILDRPFLYTIEHNGQILFIGICGNPAEE